MRRVACPMCNVLFSTTRLLQQHSTIHSEEFRKELLFVILYRELQQLDNKTAVQFLLDNIPIPKKEEQIKQMRQLKKGALEVIDHMLRTANN